MAFSLFAKLFGDPNVRAIKALQPTIDAINALEPKMVALSNPELKAMSLELKRRVAEKIGESKEQKDLQAALDEILPEAFALCREAAKRTLGQRHFDVQIMGSLTLHNGGIAEMRTGEGKT